MIITFSGGKNGWVEYVLSGTENKPRDTNLVEIIDGDFELTKKIYQSTNFKENYTRGVISFEGKIDKEKMKEVWEDFKKEFFVGYSEEEYNVAAVCHYDSDNDHIHFCIPKLNLLTQQTNQMYMDKLDRTRINVLKEWLELKHFGTTGNTTKQLTKEDKTLDFIDVWREENNQESLKFETKRQLDKTTKIINNFILEQTKLGNINNFENLQKVLKTFGIDIVKIGKDTINNFDYITIQDPISLKKIRLKGEVYGPDFWASDTKDRTNTRTTDQRDREHKQDINTTITNSYNKLQEHNYKRTEYLEARYGNARERANNQSRNNGFDNTNDIFYVTGNAITQVNLKKGENENENINTTVGTNEVSNENPTKGRIQGITKLIDTNREQMERTRTTIRDITNTIQDTTTTISRTREQLGRSEHNMKKEIDIFKENISLTDFAIKCGFEINEKKSCKTSSILERGNQKIIISKDKETNHNIYFDLETGKGGTIIDFYKNIVNDKKQFWQILSDLRNYHKTGGYKYNLIPSEKDILEVQKEAIKVKPLIKLNTYLEEKKINQDTLNEFTPYVHLDNRNNVVFIHKHFSLNNEKLEIETCGIERKNKDFKGHTCEKGLWGKKVGNNKNFYIFESPIDAMSFYQLHKKEGNYISTGGNISAEQLEDLQALAQHQKPQEIVLCFDNDAGGDLLSNRLKGIFPDSARSAKIERIKPIRKDFNEDIEKLKPKEEEKKEEYTISHSRNR